MIVKREKVKRQILRCEREIKLKELKFLGQKVQLSEATVSELTKTEAEPDPTIIKSEADLAASFLDELDFGDAKPTEPKPQAKTEPAKKPIKSNRPKPGPKSRRPGPKSITRPNEPKAVPTFDSGKIWLINYFIH